MSNPDFTGFLFKQSEWIKDWRKRWCVLKGRHLFFAKDQGIAPHDMVDIGQCLSVRTAEIGKPHALELSTKEDKTYYMYAESAAQKDSWIGAIGKAIVKAGTTYQDDDPMSSDGEDDPYAP